MLQCKSANDALNVKARVNFLVQQGSQENLSGWFRTEESKVYTL